MVRLHKYFLQASSHARTSAMEEAEEEQAKKVAGKEEEESMGERLMKMESRVELVEEQAAVCQRRSGCNSHILGELLHILPPLLPISSLEQFSHFSSNFSSESAKYNSQALSPPPASASVPVNNPTFEAPLSASTVSDQNNSAAPTPKHLKYFSTTGKILEIVSIEQQTKASKSTERTNNMNNSQKRKGVDPETSKPGQLASPHSTTRLQSIPGVGINDGMNNVNNGMENPEKAALRPDKGAENPDKVKGNPNKGIKNLNNEGVENPDSDGLGVKTLPAGNKMVSDTSELSSSANPTATSSDNKESVSEERSAVQVAGISHNEEGGEGRRKPSALSPPPPPAPAGENKFSSCNPKTTATSASNDDSKDKEPDVHENKSQSPSKTVTLSTLSDEPEGEKGKLGESQNSQSPAVPFSQLHSSHDQPSQLNHEQYPSTQLSPSQKLNAETQFSKHKSSPIPFLQHPSSRDLESQPSATCQPPSGNVSQPHKSSSPFSPCLPSWSPNHQLCANSKPQDMSSLGPTLDLPTCGSIPRESHGFPLSRERGNHFGEAYQRRLVFLGIPNTSKNGNNDKLKTLIHNLLQNILQKNVEIRSVHQVANAQRSYGYKPVLVEFESVADAEAVISSKHFFQSGSLALIIM